MKISNMYKGFYIHSVTKIKLVLNLNFITVCNIAYTTAFVHIRHLHNARKML